MMRVRVGGTSRATRRVVSRSDGLEVRFLSLLFFFFLCFRDLEGPFSSVGLGSGRGWASASDIADTNSMGGMGGYIAWGQVLPRWTG